MTPSSVTSQLESAAFTRRVFLRRATAATIAMAAGGLLGSRASVLAQTPGNGLVKVQGEFLLGPGSDGIDPATQPVALRLLVPPGKRVYPAGAEQARTGLQAFDIERTADPGRYTFTVVDRRTPLAAGHYGVVWVELTIGDDAGEADETLVERHSTWSLS